MISIVIPAHNEARVIHRCLDAICKEAEPGELEVIVACNGCHDETADIARAYGAPVRVVEVVEPGKWRGLNAGDEAAQGDTRFYIDADIHLSLDCIRQVARVLAEGQALAAAPRMAVDTRGSSWAVRAFYDIWLDTPYAKSGMIGSGVYALSAAGRARFDHFPPITADDAFARLHFANHERLTVEGCCFTITAPRHLWGLIKIKTRAYFGDLELRRYAPHLQQNDEAGNPGGLAAMAREPKRWLPLAVYLAVRLVTRLRGRYRLYFGGVRWERDDSAREWVGRGQGG